MCVIWMWLPLNGIWTSFTNILLNYVIAPSFLVQVFSILSSHQVTGRRRRIIIFAAFSTSKKTLSFGKIKCDCFNILLPLALIGFQSTCTEFGIIPDWRMLVSGAHLEFWGEGGRLNLKLYIIYVWL